MSIFGDVDIASIPDDGFKIEPDWYRAVIVKAGYNENEQTGHESLKLEWTIDDPESDYHGWSLFDNLLTPRGMLQDELEDKKLKFRLSFLKKRLRRGLDLSEEEMVTANPSDLVSKVAYVKVVNTVDRDDEDTTYNNIRDALSERLYEEKFGNVEATMGL